MMMKKYLFLTVFLGAFFVATASAKLEELSIDPQSCFGNAYCLRSSLQRMRTLNDLNAYMRSFSVESFDSQEGRNAFETSLRIRPEGDERCSNIENRAVRILCEYGNRINTGEHVDCSKEPEEEYFLDSGGGVQTVQNRHLCISRQIALKPNAETCSAYAKNPDLFLLCVTDLALRLRDSSSCSLLKDKEDLSQCLRLQSHDPAQCMNEECDTDLWSYQTYLAPENGDLPACSSLSSWRKERCETQLQTVLAVRKNDVTICPEGYSMRGCMRTVLRKFLFENPDSDGAIMLDKTCNRIANRDSRGTCSSLLKDETATREAFRQQNPLLCATEDYEACMGYFLKDNRVERSHCERLSEIQQSNCEKLVRETEAVTMKDFSKCSSAACTDAVARSMFSSSDPRPCSTVKSAPQARNQCYLDFEERQGLKTKNSSLCKSTNCLFHLLKLTGKALDCRSIATESSCKGSTQGSCPAPVEVSERKRLTNYCEDVNKSFLAGGFRTPGQCLSLHEENQFLCLRTVFTKATERHHTVTPAFCEDIPRTKATERFFSKTCFDAVALKTDNIGSCASSGCIVSIEQEFLSRDISLLKKLQCVPASPSLHSVWKESKLADACEKKRDLLLGQSSQSVSKTNIPSPLTLSVQRRLLQRIHRNSP